MKSKRKKQKYEYVLNLNKYLKDYRVSVGYINLNNGFDIANYVFENLTNTDAAIFAKDTQKSTIKNNTLYEINKK